MVISGGCNDINGCGPWSNVACLTHFRLRTELSVTKAIKTLTYAVRPRVVGKYLGQLGLMLALLTLPPLSVSMLLGEYDAGARYGAVIALLGLAGWPLVRIPAPQRIQTNEALATVALAFTLWPLIMAYPFAAQNVPVADALFEAASAVTTTGLSTMASVENQPKGFLFTRAWIQWYGGLGIVVLSVALLMGHHAAARRLAEPVNAENLLSTARTHARRMIQVYVVLTLAALIAVWVLIADGFDALTHVMTAVSTAGFSTHDNNIAGIPQWSARYVLMLAAFIGAVPLPLLYYSWRQGWRRLLSDPEPRALLLAALMVTALLVLFMYLNEPQDMSLADAGILGLSAQTSTGFSTTNVVELDPASKLVLIGAMFTGGGVGSTAGGIKILRLIIILRLIQMALARTAMPSHAVHEPRMGNKTLAPDDLHRALLVVLLFGLVICISWLIFVSYGYEPIDALFEVVSATGTVGLTTGITGPDLEPELKLILALDMLLGRLEIVAMLILIYPKTWFGKRDESL